MRRQRRPPPLNHSAGPRRTRPLGRPPSSQSDTSSPHTRYRLASAWLHHWNRPASRRSALALEAYGAAPSPPTTEPNLHLPPTPVGHPHTHRSSYPIRLTLLRTARPLPSLPRIQPWRLRIRRPPGARLGARAALEGRLRLGGRRSHAEQPGLGLLPLGDLSCELFVGTVSAEGESGVGGGEVGGGEGERDRLGGGRRGAGEGPGVSRGRWVVSWED